MKILLQILARTKDSSQESGSNEVWVRTYQQPARVTMVNHTHNSITVNWWSSTDRSMGGHKIQYTQVGITVGYISEIN